MTATDWFSKEFENLNKFKPFPWHITLFRKFLAGDLPSSCDIPTGLGKTKIITIWWLARQYVEQNGGAHVNLRLAYLVNRRTIVDQATIEAETIADKFPGVLNISTLRGQRVDNKLWSENPEKPAILVGTPDMLGSKLLFGGYGDGKYTRPIHTGIIGNDTLYVIDEAHLSGPLCETIAYVKKQQNADAELPAVAGFGIKPINLIELTATPINTHGSTLTLSQEDYQNPTISQRLNAVKTATLQKVQHGKAQICSNISKLASTHDQSAAKVLIYVNSPDFAKTIRDTLSKRHGAHRVALLTGTLRGYERDDLIQNDPVIQAFLKDGKVAQTVYLVSTSAGEVGWDIDADHMVCDLTPIDSMIQRLGRVNRKGGRTATVNVICGVSPKMTTDSDYKRACDATCDLVFATWNGKDLSPAALKQWLQTVPPADYLAAISPPATPVPLHPHALDAWAMTSIGSALPCKHSLPNYIHGVNDSEPEAYVAWRSELPYLEESGVDLNEWFTTCRLQPQELMRGRASVVLGELKQLTKGQDDVKLVLIDPEYQAKLISVRDLQGLAEINNSTIILPHSVGGLTNGLLDANNHSPVEDVADRSNDSPRLTVLVRKTDDSCEVDIRPFGFPVAGTVQKFAKSIGLMVRKAFPFENDAGLSLAVLTKRKSRQTSSDQPTVDDHCQSVADQAVNLSNKLGMSPVAIDTLEWAAKMHDLGKKEGVWQRFILNFEDPPLAKPGDKGTSLPMLGSKETGFYRHEFGSLVMAGEAPAGVDRDLALYLISCHHGHARPHFKRGAAGPFPFDETNVEVGCRFDDLQHRYGRWGLAWLHAIFCLADQRGS